MSYPAHPHTLFKKIWNTAKNDKSSIRPRLVLAGDALECSDIFKKDCVCYGSCGGQTILFFFKDFQEHGDEPETCRGAWVTRIVVRFTNVIFELLVKLAMREGVWVLRRSGPGSPQILKSSKMIKLISCDFSWGFLDIPRYSCQAFHLCPAAMAVLSFRCLIERIYVQRNAIKPSLHLRTTGCDQESPNEIGLAENRIHGDPSSSRIATVLALSWFTDSIRFQGTADRALWPNGMPRPSTVVRKNAERSSGSRHMASGQRKM